MMKAKETLDQAIEQLTQLRIEMQKQGVTDLDDKASDLNLLLCKAHDQCDLADVGKSCNHQYVPFGCGFDKVCKVCGIVAPVE